MKYKVIGERIKQFMKEAGYTERRIAWVEDVDGKIVDFENGKVFARVDGYYINREWCEPICDNKNIIEKIKEYCIKNIERIDHMTESTVSTDVDIGMDYTYRKILDIIESEGKNNDIKN